MRNVSFLTLLKKTLKIGRLDCVIVEFVKHIFKVQVLTTYFNLVMTKSFYIGIDNTF